MYFSIQRVPKTSKSDLGHITPYFDYVLSHVSDRGAKTALVVVEGLDPTFQSPKPEASLAAEVADVIDRFERAFPDHDVETLGFTVHSTTKQEWDFA